MKYFFAQQDKQEMQGIAYCCCQDHCPTEDTTTEGGCHFLIHISTSYGVDTQSEDLCRDLSDWCTNTQMCQNHAQLQQLFFVLRRKSLSTALGTFVKNGISVLR
jgi:hypothetical protein